LFSNAIVIEVISFGFKFKIKFIMTKIKRKQNRKTVFLSGDKVLKRLMDVIKTMFDLKKKHLFLN